MRKTLLTLAIGAAVAEPDRLTVAVLGVGGAMRASAASIDASTWAATSACTRSASSYTHVIDEPGMMSWNCCTSTSFHSRSSSVATARSSTDDTAPHRTDHQRSPPCVDQARAGQDPKAVWEAVQWLRQCASNEGRRTSFEALRNQGVSPEMMTQLMVEADAEARRCQTVTAAHRALLPELASRAMRAGLPEAASAYAGSVFPGDLTAAQRSEVAEAMRRDALAGDVPSLLGALTAHEAWGLTDEERLSYLVAYAALGGQPAQTMAKTLIDNRQIRFRTQPTPEQLEAAMRQARPWLERLRAARGG